MDSGVCSESQASTLTAQCADDGPNAIGSATELKGSTDENGDTAKLRSSATTARCANDDLNTAGLTEPSGSPEGNEDTAKSKSLNSLRDASSSNRPSRNNNETSALKPSATYSELDALQSIMTAPTLTNKRKKYWSGLIDKFLLQRLLEGHLDNVTYSDVKR
ncbi:hypothetical protein QBC46DRAFT_411048 [Diplogelasinospora grovesii]|uniref:Uncharacterized protein n=1 Tax=Diplogelasinospora grovesii TaxID=303347 RepID=A0AAN6N526_9PEZI|nr:hypothetical protein QBC46DRAFT_411048 [Diplogelasinospora grovesii]